MVNYFVTLSGEGYVLTQSGAIPEKFFSEALTISLDLSEGKVTANEKIPLVSQLRQINMVAQAVFNIPA